MLCLECIRRAKHRRGSSRLRQGVSSTLPLSTSFQTYSRRRKGSCLGGGTCCTWLQARHLLATQLPWSRSPCFLFPCSPTLLAQIYFNVYFPFSPNWRESPRLGTTGICACTGVRSVRARGKFFHSTPILSKYRPTYCPLKDPPPFSGTSGACASLFSYVHGKIQKIQIGKICRA